MTLQDFNQLSREELEEKLGTCCGSQTWVRSVIGKLPYGNAQSLLQQAQYAWYKECTQADWLEAFTHHPRIGDKNNVSEKVQDSIHLAVVEQSGVEENDAKLLLKLHAANIEYEAKFGFTFIVCATGKKGVQMMALLEDRIRNTEDEELRIAMGEQWKITLIRMKKWLNEVEFTGSNSQVTTHILDTSVGKPASGVTVHLFQFEVEAWKKMATGRTNEDGRIPDLLPPFLRLEKNKYKLVFETEGYFADSGQESFYPEVQIIFNIKDESHYHVPLLLNPYGYSTYRGS